MLRKGLALVGIGVLTVACSGGGSGGAGITSGANVATSVTSQFIDAPVNGLTYATKNASGNSVHGRTQGNGNFPCIRGELVSFSIGHKDNGLHLGQAICGEKVFIHDLDTAADDNAVDQIGAIIQSFAPADGGKLVIPESIQNLDIKSIFNDNDSNPLSVERLLQATAGGNINTKISSIVADVSSASSVTFTPVTVETARTHINNALVTYADTNLSTLFDPFANAESTNATNMASNRSKEIRILAKGQGACRDIDLDFYMGVKKESNNYSIYAYTTYDRIEKMGFGANAPTYCGRMGRNQANDHDGQCFAYKIAEQRIMSNSISIRTKFYDTDEYLESLSENPSSPLALNWPEELAYSLYDVAANFYLEGNRIKGRIKMDINPELDQEEYEIPTKCEYLIDQRVDETFPGEDYEAERQNEIATIVGTYQGSNQIRCEEIDAQGTPATFNLGGRVRVVYDAESQHGFRSTEFRLTRNSTVLYNNTNDLMTNDDNTPYDIPFVSFSFLTDSGVEVDGYGHNEWDVAGYRISLWYWSPSETKAYSCDGVLPKVSPN